MTHAILFAVLLSAVACGEVARAPSVQGEDIEPGIVMLTAEESLSVWARPDSSARAWGTIAPGDSVIVSVRTADGWLGFDPGVAQAGNSGSFRYRWIAMAGPFSLVGNPARLEIVWGPSEGIAYAMTFDPAAIHLEPDSLSTVIDYLPGTSAAAIELAIPGWCEIDPSGGPSPETQPGWVRIDDVSINGEIPAETVVEDN